MNSQEDLSFAPLFSTTLYDTQAGRLHIEPEELGA